MVILALVWFEGVILSSRQYARTALKKRSSSATLPFRTPTREFLFFQNFERPFTPRTWLRSASNFVKTHFRRFRTFHFPTSKNNCPEFFGLKHMVFNILFRFLRSNDQTDVRIEFYAKKYAYKFILRSVRLKIAKIRPCVSITALRILGSKGLRV